MSTTTALLDIDARLEVAIETLHTGARALPPREDTHLIWCAIYALEAAAAKLGDLQAELHHAQLTATPHPEVGTVEMSVLLSEREYADLAALADGPEQVAECAGSLVRQALAEIREAAR